MSKNDKIETVLIRVSTHTRDMANKIHKVVAVESNGEIMSKTKSLEIALEEFLDKREDEK